MTLMMLIIFFYIFVVQGMQKFAESWLFK